MSRYNLLSKFAGELYVGTNEDGGVQLEVGTLDDLTHLLTVIATGLQGDNAINATDALKNTTLAQAITILKTIR